MKIRNLCPPLYLLLLGATLCLQATSAVAKKAAPAAPAPEEALLVSETDRLPDLSELIPLGSDLSGRLSQLEETIAAGLVVPDTEAELNAMGEALRSSDEKIARIAKMREGRPAALLKLRRDMESQQDSFQALNRPLKKEIDQLGKAGGTWRLEKNKWTTWQAELLEKGGGKQLSTLFTQTLGVIDSAQGLIHDRLEVLLAAQVEAGKIQQQIKALFSEMESKTLAEYQGAVVSESPPMYSPKYWSQFNGKLWKGLARGTRQITWPDREFWNKTGWVLFVQVALALGLLLAIRRNRKRLKDSDRWHFLVDRPFASAILAGIVLTAYGYVREGVLPVWSLLGLVLGGIAMARMVGALNQPPWKKQFVRGLVLVLITTAVVFVIQTPSPLVRAYTVLAALAGMIFCWRLARQSRVDPPSILYTWSFGLGSLTFAFIVLAEIIGRQGLAEYLFMSLIFSVAVTWFALMLMYVAHGAWEALFRIPRLQSLLQPESPETRAVIRQIEYLTDIAVCVLLLLPSLLTIWGWADSYPGALKGLMTLGIEFNVGRLTLGLVMQVIVILYGSFILSWVVQKLMMDPALRRRQVDQGARYSIERLAHYVIVVIGFMLAISTLGFDVSKLTLMVSALGVGIGFGLQGIVNDLVCGLILLFERPCRVGDAVVVGGRWATVRKIGLRSTKIKTYDEADVIVPNSDFTSKEVINWTLSDRRVRVEIPVGVAYGSDVQQVMKTLRACATSTQYVMENPAPNVLFMDFGASSLDFILWAWVADFSHKLTVVSELHQEIERQFREQGITIAFPQLDVHMSQADPAEPLPQGEEGGPAS